MNEAFNLDGTVDEQSKTLSRILVQEMNSEMVRLIIFEKRRRRRRSKMLWSLLLLLTSVAAGLTSLLVWRSLQVESNPQLDFWLTLLSASAAVIISAITLFSSIQTMRRSKTNLRLEEIAHFERSRNAEEALRRVLSDHEQNKGSDQ